MMTSPNPKKLKPGYKQTEVGVIPQDWDVCDVRKIGEVITGKALAVNAPGPKRPYLRTKNVFDGRIDIGDVLTMPMTDVQFEQFRIRSGDVLLNEGQSIELVGRCSLYQDEYPEPCAIQNALLRFRAHAGVSGNFASYLFRNCQQTGVFARIALQTTSVAHLGGKRFEKLRLAWPPLPEQRAIATALSDVDGLLGGLDRLIAKKRDLKQAAMQQLLTPPVPGGLGQTRLPGFHGEWEVKPLGEIGGVRMCKRVLKHQTREHGDVPFYKIGTFGGVPDAFIAQSLFDEFKRKYSFPQKGDVLISAAGTIGRTVVYDGAPAYFQDSNIVWIDNDESKATNAYLWHRYQVTKWSVSHGGTVARLYNDSLRTKIFIPVPPLPEQTAIAEVLTEMDAELAVLTQRREKTRALKQAMMQELLTGRTRLIPSGSAIATEEKR